MSRVCTDELDRTPYNLSAMAWRSVAKRVTGFVLAALLFTLGLIARLPAVTQLGMRIDRHLAWYDRTAAGVTIAAWLTRIATPEIVGIGAVLLLPFGVWLAGRRVDAIRTFWTIGGALALALTAKTFVVEQRPPAPLWAIPADSGASYPSGHTTVAAAVAIAVVALSRVRATRLTATTLGTLYTVGVAGSRIYVANHYLTDVVGSIFAALAASVIVSALMDVPAVRRCLARVERPDGESP
jgi:membrane-associated phospholipid phosphatase